MFKIKSNKGLNIIKKKEIKRFLKLIIVKYAGHKEMNERT
jgi:hypothetical protein